MRSVPAQGKCFQGWHTSALVLGQGWQVWSLWPVRGGTEGCGYFSKREQDFLLSPVISLQIVPSASGEGGQTVEMTGRWDGA